MRDAVVWIRSTGDAVRELPGQVPLLTRLIKREPDVAVHYLLRGEEWLLYGYDNRARDDFLTARQLAADMAATSGWGYLAQAYMDRCDTGLRRCDR